jgi:hypothetical protein
MPGSGLCSFGAHKQVGETNNNQIIMHKYIIMFWEMFRKEKKYDFLEPIVNISHPDRGFFFKEGILKLRSE